MGDMTLRLVCGTLEPLGNVGWRSKGGSDHERRGGGGVVREVLSDWIFHSRPGLGFVVLVGDSVQRVIEGSLVTSDITRGFYRTLSKNVSRRELVWSQHVCSLKSSAAQASCQ